MKQQPWYEWVFDKLYYDIYGPQADPYNDEDAKRIRSLLNLKKGDSVLDLGCGYGRHCVPLARAGLKVTGIDISQFLLKKAKEENNKYKLAIEYVKADMRELPFENCFDAVVNNYQSFGFFSHDKNAEVFKQTAKALKPNGKFLIEQVNIFNDVMTGRRNRKDFDPKHPKWLSVVSIDTNPYTHLQTYNWKVYSTRSGKQERDVDVTYYLYTIPELARMAEPAGLKLIKAYNDDLQEYRFSEKGMIVIFQKGH